MKYCSYKALEIGLFSFGAFCIFGTLGKYFGAFISTFLALLFGSIVKFKFFAFFGTWTSRVTNLGIFCWALATYFYRSSCNNSQINLLNKF